jgi:hypothetical protein
MAEALKVPSRMPVLVYRRLIMSMANLLAPEQHQPSGNRQNDRQGNGDHNRRAHVQRICVVAPLVLGIS